MLLIFHIAVALLSLVLASLAYISPSRVKITSSYAASAAMLLSGSALVVTSRAHLIEACIFGLLFVGVVALQLAGAKRKLEKSSGSL